jgi:hypothetical protein
MITYSPPWYQSSRPADHHQAASPAPAPRVAKSRPGHTRGLLMATDTQWMDPAATRSPSLAGRVGRITWSSRENLTRSADQ